MAMSASNTPVNHRSKPPPAASPAREVDERISRFPSEYTSDDNIVRHSLSDPDAMLVDREHALAERSKRPDPVFRPVQARVAQPKPTRAPRDFPTPEELNRDARLMGDVQAPHEEEALTGT